MGVTKAAGLAGGADGTVQEKGEVWYVGSKACWQNLPWHSFRHASEARIGVTWSAHARKRIGTPLPDPIVVPQANELLQGAGGLGLIGPRDPHQLMLMAGIEQVTARLKQASCKRARDKSSALLQAVQRFCWQAKNNFKQEAWHRNGEIAVADPHCPASCRVIKG